MTTYFCFAAEDILLDTFVFSSGSLLFHFPFFSVSQRDIEGLEADLNGLLHWAFLSFGLRYSYVHDQKISRQEEDEFIVFISPSFFLVVATGWLSLSTGKYSS